jgi:putative transposase
MKIFFNLQHAKYITQLFVHIIFAVKGRSNFLSEDRQEEIFKYVSGIITNKNQKPLIVNGTENHVHILLSFSPVVSISDLVRDIKNNSSGFISNKYFKGYRFEWQEGYGAFTYSKSQLDTVYNYSKNQKEHHKKKSFKEEYMDFLKKFEITYNEKYLFDWYE